MEVLVIVIFSLLAATMIALLTKKFVDFRTRVRKLKEEGALKDSKPAENEEEGTY